jgi:surfeit locus 1 family protein
MKPRIWPILLASGLGLALLLWLGMWQVQRLAWKNALIAQIDQSINQSAKKIGNQSELLNLSRVNQKIRLKGNFRGKYRRKIASVDGAPGWEIVSRFYPDPDSHLDVGLGSTVLLVSHGFVSMDIEPFVTGNSIEIEGILKLHPTVPGYFDVPNNPAKNEWYTWDVKAMAAVADINVSPFVLHLLPGSSGTEGFVVTAPIATLRNNHLGYAITWFGLAAVLVVMTGIYLFQNRHSKRARNAVE